MKVADMTRWKGSPVLGVMSCLTNRARSTTLKNTKWNKAHQVLSSVLLSSLFVYYSALQTQAEEKWAMSLFMWVLNLTWATVSYARYERISIDMALGLMSKLLQSSHSRNFEAFFATVIKWFELWNDEFTLFKVVMETLRLLLFNNNEGHVRSLRLKCLWHYTVYISYCREMNPVHMMFIVITVKSCDLQKPVSSDLRTDHHRWYLTYCNTVHTVKRNCKSKTHLTRSHLINTQ